MCDLCEYSNVIYVENKMMMETYWEIVQMNICDSTTVSTMCNNVIIMITQKVIYTWKHTGDHQNVIYVKKFVTCEYEIVTYVNIQV